MLYMHTELTTFNKDRHGLGAGEERVEVVDSMTTVRKTSPFT